MAKKLKNVGKDYLVLSGSHYSGCVGICIEAVELKSRGVWLKLEISDGDIWFNESELKEF